MKFSVFPQIYSKLISRQSKFLLIQLYKYYSLISDFELPSHLSASRGFFQRTPTQRAQLEIKKLEAKKKRNLAKGKRLEKEQKELHEQVLELDKAKEMLESSRKKERA